MSIDADIIEMMSQNLPHSLFPVPASSVQVQALDDHPVVRGLVTVVGRQHLKLEGEFVNWNGVLPGIVLHGSS